MTRDEKIAFLESRGWVSKAKAMWWTRDDIQSVLRIDAAISREIDQNPSAIADSVGIKTGNPIAEMMEEALTGDIKRVRRENTYHYWERLGA